MSVYIVRGKGLCWCMTVRVKGLCRCILYKLKGCVGA